MNESKIDSILKKIFVVFILIQPFLDIYFLYTDTVMNIFKFSPSTLIRFAVIGILFVYMIYKYRKDKKILPVIGYIVFSIIYAIIHHIFVRNFKSFDPNNFNYSAFTEFFYIARLILPVIIMFIVIDFKFTFDDFIKNLEIVACIVGTVIVFSNIFKIGLASYTNEIIKDNIFGWFTGAYTKYSFYELASKGWFNFANQISALLLLLCVVTIYSFIRKMTLFRGYNMIVILLSMLMIGTKVALYGAYLSLAIIVFVYTIDLIKNKKIGDLEKKSLIVILILFVGYTGMVKFSPGKNRAEINNYIAENREKKTDEEDEIDMDELNKELEKVKTGTKEEKIDFIEKNYEYYSIAPEFIEDSYSYKIDPDFWITEFQKPLTDRLNYRKLEEQMIKRVVEVNGNSSSRWFGISYIRVQNIFNIERDFILQYYTIGIIGLILFIFIPFIATIIFCGYVILKKYKDLLNIENMILIASVILILGIAYFSGNIIDSLIITIYISFIIGVIFNNIFKKKSETKSIEE